MTFEEQLLQLPLVKDVQEVKLLKHARKAAQNPEIGITIQVKSAYNVIGHCATIATMYIPLVVYSKISQPIKELQNWFTKTQIEDFVNRSKVELHTHQLLRCLLYDIDKYIGENNIHTNQSIVTENGVYGDYDIVNSKLPELQDKIISILGVTKL